MALLFVGAHFLSGKLIKKPRPTQITLSLTYKQAQKNIVPSMASLQCRPPRRPAAPVRKKHTRARLLIKKKKSKVVRKSKKKSPPKMPIKKNELNYLEPKKVEPVETKKVQAVQMANTAPAQASVPDDFLVPDTTQNQRVLETIPSPSSGPSQETSIASLGKTKPVAELVTEAKPEYLKNSPPIYPLMAKRRGYEGTVILEVFVSKDGKVKDLKVFRSSGHKILDKAAVKAVWKWMFQPARKGDRAIGAWVRVPIKFELK